MNKLKLELIEDWRNFWRFWSVRLGVIGSALTGYLVAFPDQALQAWAMLPADLKAYLPERYMPLVDVKIFVLSMIARVVKQSKLQPKEGVENDKQSQA